MSYTAPVDHDEKQSALLQHVQEDYPETTLDEIDHQHGDTFNTPIGEFMILTETEADDLWDEQLENYIDENILPELPEAYRNYFDCEAWKRDAKFDGRGHTLSSYDGNEYEIFIDEECYLAYRTN